MMPAAVQKFPRYQVNAAVDLIHPSSQLAANLHNISLGGMFVATPTLWRPGHRVQAVVGLPRGPLTAPCRIVHALDSNGALVKGHPVGMGLEFDALGDDAHTALKAFVGALGRVTVEQPQPGPSRANRTSVRWTDARRVNVALSPSATGDWWVRNISQGGMYLETDAPPPRGTTLAVTLEAPGGTLQLQAEVVHVVDAATARTLGHPSGVGVQFLDLSKAHWEALKGYLDGVTTALHVDVGAQAPPHAPLERVVNAVRRFYEGLEAQDGFAALGLPLDASLAQLEERATALDLVLSVPPPTASPPQRARMESVRKALPRVRHAVERAIAARPPARPAEITRTPAVSTPAPPRQEAAPQPASADVFLKDAAGQLDRGDLEGALDAIKDGLRVCPGDARLTRLWQDVAARHKAETVEGLLASALVLAGTQGMRLQAAARAQQALGMMRTPAVCQRALQVLLLAQDHKGVVALARDLVAQDRNDPAAYQALLEVYTQAGHVALAVRTAETLLRLRPKDTALRSRLEKLKSRLG